MPHASNRAHMRTHALTPDRRRGQPRAETNKSHVARRLSRLSRAHASRRRSAAPPRVISTAPQRIPPKHRSAPSLAHRPISNFASLHSLAGLLAVFLLRALPRHAAQSRAAACRGVPQRAAACRGVPQRAAACRGVPQRAAACRGVPQRAAQIVGAVQRDEHSRVAAAESAQAVAAR